MPTIIEANGWREARLRPTPLASTCLTRADESLASLKANRILRTAVSAEEVLQHRASWESQAEKREAQKQELETKSSASIVVKAERARERARAAFKAKKQEEEEQRRAFQAALKEAEAEALTARQRAREDELRRFKKLNEASEREFRFRKWHGDTKLAGSDELRHQLDSHFQTTLQRAAGNRQSRDAFLRAQTASYEARRKGVRASRDELEAELERGIAQLERRHRLRFEQARKVMETRAQRAAERARQHASQLADTARKAQERANAELERRESHMKLAASASADRLRQEHELRRQERAEKSAQRNETLRSNLSRLELEQQERQRHSEALYASTKQRCDHLDYTRLVTDLEQQTKNRKAMDVQGHLQVVERKALLLQRRSDDVRSMLGAVGRTPGVDLHLG